MSTSASRTRVPKPLERVAAPLGVCECRLEHADSGLQVAQLRVGATERIRDRERSLRVRLGGLLEERDGSAGVADRVRDLAQAGERARPQRPIVRIEGRGEQPLGLHRVAEAERDLRVEQPILRESRMPGGELVGVGAETAREPAQELERRNPLALLEPRHVCGRADAPRERTLAQSCALSSFAEPAGQPRRRVDMVRLLARHFATIGTSPRGR